MERDGQDVIHLGVGDPDLNTPPRIVAAAVNGMKNGRTHYSPIPGEPLLREAAAETYAIDLDVSVEPAQVTFFLAHNRHY
jgi:aspartate/methionine/tyrosine aminotransferase